MAGFRGECAVKLKYELKFYLWRAPTLVNFFRVRDFHKDDTLAQTNQIKYDCFFLHGTENIKKLFSQDLKLETKIPGTFLRLYIVL